MKIISKFTDYYDSVQGVMFDSDIIFRRQTSDAIDMCDHTKLKTASGKYVLSIANVGFVGFCGKIYPYVRFANPKYHNYDRYGISSGVIDALLKLKFFNFNDDGLQYFYDIENIENVIWEAYGKHDRNSRFYKPVRHTLTPYINARMEQLYDMKLFERYTTPIFHIKSLPHHIEFVSLPRLCDYEFYKVFDAFTTYQEIVMYINNLAVNEYPPQIVDDKVLRDSKGFNEWSFKNMPKKKR